MASEQLCIALLAAGSSQRFGDQDKLAQDLGGQMLGLQMARRLAAVGDHRIVVTSDADHPCTGDWHKLGFAIEVNDNAASGMGSSVAAAAQYANNIGAEALLICLADMPLVPISHCEALITELNKSGSEFIATSDGMRSMPPAIFRSSLLSQLSNLSGDEGARQLIRSAPTLTLEPELLIDIDTPDDLEKARQFCDLFRSD